MKNLLFIISFALLLVSCSNDSKKQSTITKFNTQVTDITAGHQKSVKDINTYVIMSGASFMPEVINNPQSVQNYKTTPYLAAVNLGVYTTDVLYQAAYKRSEGTMLSYGAAKDLAYHIGIGEVFDEIFLKEIEEGVNKDDSIMYKLTDALNNSKTVLKEKDQARLLTAITIGSFLEKLYITNSIIFNYPEDLPADTKLLVLRESIMVLAIQVKEEAELTKLFKNYKPHTDKAKKVYNLLKEISTIYAPMKLEDNIQELQPEEIFENTELLKAFDKIKALRSMIISEE